jgi:hypothetical protein
MKRTLILAAIAVTGLTLAACGPAPLKAPLPGRGDTTAIPTPTGQFPFLSGIWRDDLGNSWSASVNGPGTGSQTVTAQNTTGAAAGLVLLGDITGGVLTYRIATPDGTVLATGTAMMINGNHAFFNTVNADGSANADGVLHINHAPPLQSVGGGCAAPAPTPGLEGGANPDPQPVLPEVPGPRDLRPTEPSAT